MLKFLEMLNENLGTNYKNVSEFAKANTENKVDMKVLGETIFQYIKYQDAISNINHKAFKVELKVKKDSV